MLESLIILIFCFTGVADLRILKDSLSWRKASSQRTMTSTLFISCISTGRKTQISPSPSSNSAGPHTQSVTTCTPKSCVDKIRDLHVWSESPSQSFSSFPWPLPSNQKQLTKLKSISIKFWQCDLKCCQKSIEITLELRDCKANNIMESQIVILSPSPIRWPRLPGLQTCCQ